MIPAAYITEWQQVAPWQHPDMVEQDLVISRVLIELFNNDWIARHLAFRGGTALYKLSLLPAARYSEDIDLVQIDAEPIGATIDYIHNILDPWLGKPRYDTKDRSYRLTYRFISETETPLRIKVEINTREHTGDTITKPFSVNCRWFTGTAEITTFTLAELLGTKLRALYQRKKGRDLFDLDYALRHSEIDGRQVTDFFVKYMAEEGNHVSANEFLDNLKQKCEDTQFCQDMIPLLRNGITFTAEEAVG